MLVFDYEIKLPDANKLIKQYGLEPYGKVQIAVDSAIVDFSAPYTPFKTGELQGSVNSSVGSGMLVYSPDTYASYVWNGVSKNGKKLVYNTSYHSKATSHWVEEAMKVHLQDVCRIAENKIKEM